MRSFTWFAAGIAGTLILATHAAPAATISGTITGPDKAGFRGAFVQARNAKTHIMVSVLSDPQGHYAIENLPAGEYRLGIKAPGFKADSRFGLQLGADQTLTSDFALQKSFVRWSDISMYQGKQLLPEARGKQVYFQHCMACHGFESRMATSAAPSPRRTRG